MGNNFSGVAGDPNNNCLYCKLGVSWGWKIEAVFHTHDDTTPSFSKSKEEDIDPLSYLGTDVKIYPQEIEEANNSIQQFFEGSGFDPKADLTFDFVITLAKISKYRIHKPLNISGEIQIMLDNAKSGNFN